MVGYQAYQKNEVTTSTPLGLVLLSYEALYKTLGRAKHAIDGGDLAAEADHTSRAMEAIIELSSSLNMEEGGDIAKDLAELYGYMLRRLSEGLCSCSTSSVDEVMLLVLTLREAWQAISSEMVEHKEAKVAPIPKPMQVAMGYGVCA